MRRLRFVLIALLAFASVGGAQKSHHASSGAPKTREMVAGTGTGSSHKGAHFTTPSGKSHASKLPRASTPHASNRAAPSAVPPSSNGKIARSAEAKRTFEKQSGHPNGWPGHVVDHIVPLACGGADAPSNMQWQTIAEGKAKDKTERIGCGRR